MDREKSRKLIIKYPELFHQCLDKKPSTMMWGFECGDGWYKILDRLADRITEHVEKKRQTDPNFAVYAIQVKEKFHGLRFYIFGGDEAVYSLIDQAEAESMQICESCGAENCHVDGIFLKIHCKICGR